MNKNAIISQLKKEIESLKASNQELKIYVVSIDKDGNESEPTLLLTCKLGDVL